ncbi:MAG TPA: type IV pilus modification protein PilV [Burkholderiaceae bacterium]|nr:type IV pilus modification protein PilV [Burkholderiaceae bacterium]
MRSRLIAGFAMVEAMVTVVVVAFGLLGVAGLVSRSFVAEVDGTQRTQAVLLLQDMATRIEANRTNAAAYVTGDTGVTGYVTTVSGGVTTTTTVACDPAAMLAERDRCEWSRLLAGTNEQVDTRNAGVLVGAIGCIYEIDGFNRIYAVTIAWQGMSAGPVPPVNNAPAPNGFPPNECGRNRFDDESLGQTTRRVITMPVRLATLT